MSKDLLDAYGMVYVSAKHEADELCGALNNEVICVSYRRYRYNGLWL